MGQVSAHNQRTFAKGSRTHSSRRGNGRFTYAAFAEIENNAHKIPVLYTIFAGKNVLTLKRSALCPHKPPETAGKSDNNLRVYVRMMAASGYVLPVIGRECKQARKKLQRSAEPILEVHTLMHSYVVISQ
jgi:hypothetical protein